ncbi:hypothetical protein D3C78_1824670 [compost metagenome]
MADLPKAADALIGDATDHQVAGTGMREDHPIGEIQLAGVYRHEVALGDDVDDCLAERENTGGHQNASRNCRVEFETTG